MKRSLALISILGCVALSAFGQATTSARPRVAVTPTPPVLTNDQTYGNPTPGGPPVLKGGNSRPSAQPTPTPSVDDPNEVIKVETNLVTMPVSVLDRDGRFISGLQQRDFKIFENGTEQKIDYFQSVEQPFTVVLLIDVSPSTQFRIDEIQNAAITFIDKLRPSDRVMVISFDDQIHVLTPATNDRNRLRNAIRQVEFGDGTSLYDAVSYAIDNELRHIEGRKAVVLFSDGVDTTSRRATYDSTLRDTEELDALFYTIRYDTSADMGGGWGGNPRRGGGGGGYPGGRRSGGVSMADILGAIITGGNVGGNRGGGGWGRGGNGSGAEYERGKRYLESLAMNSGGREFEAQSMYNIDAAFQGIAEELRQQYSVGYYPDKVGQLGDRKQIKIRVMRPNVVVRAKNSYVVGQTNRNIAGK
jgi:Ca-activated chloride channel family protein